MNDIQEKIKAYLANEILAGDADGLNNETPLITGGLLDSISTLQLVDFLEKTFSIEFKAHEVDQEYLNTIDLIAKTIFDKLSEK
jgi:acyl carrier protein